MKFLCTRKLNQDHVENLHCMIRLKHAADDHPFPQAYVNALRILSCKSLTAELIALEHPNGANCEPEPWDLPAEKQSGTCMDLQATESESDDVDDEGRVEEALFVADIKAISDIEAETAVYIAGAAVRKFMSSKDCCSDCLNACIDGAAPMMTFSKHKDFTQESLLNTSLPLRNIVVHFEQFFKAVVDKAILMQHPRHFIMTSFFSSVVVDYSSLSCDEHSHRIASEVLSEYCNIRLFHSVKLLNAQLQGGKKKNELTKNKKLGL